MSNPSRVVVGSQTLLAAAVPWLGFVGILYLVSLYNYLLFHTLAELFSISVAAAVFMLVAVVRGPAFPATAAGWLAVAAIALVSTVVAITLYFAGLARVGPTRAATLSTLEPVFTVVLAALLLRERIERVQLAGGALILAAVVLLARGAPLQAAGPRETT